MVWGVGFSLRRVQCTILRVMKSRIHELHGVCRVWSLGFRVYRV